MPEDHRVRLVWRFVEGLDLTPLQAAIKAVEGHGPSGGRPADLLALWLYATVKGIGSARELARLCEEHIAYRWLCGGVSMNPKTLADFRVGHGAVLERLLVDSFTALVRAGVASLDRIAQDGVRGARRGGSGIVSPALDAWRHAGARRSRRSGTCVRGSKPIPVGQSPASRRPAACGEERERRVRAALAVTEDAACPAAGEGALAAERRSRKPSVRRRSAQDGAEAAKRQDAADKPREPRASTTDAEARVMKMADGGFRPAYNVQFAADTESGAIAGVSVDNIGSDMGKMAPMSDALAKQYDERPGQHLADGGFAKLDDIEALARHGVEAFVPVPKPRDPDRDRHAPCRGDTPAIAAWRQRMGRDDAKEIYKERAATVECANAQARNRGDDAVRRARPGKSQGGRSVVRLGAQHDVRLAVDRGMSRPTQ